eukprot:TRINITY_DN19109_c0_g1_i1.p1 TRINITY_DN19109_c0_g1~~TRINITY_DN19109_c0_g1_i1.p1  ORF type:complete len:957 (-),score=119.59 TRINITY_DN19109_c0_g1_i1:423-3293(-)
MYLNLGAAAVVLALHCVAALPAPEGDPVADPAAVVRHGAARFTVFTERMLRLEYSTESPPVFEDRQTLTIINRKLPVPPYSALTDTNGTLTVTTRYLRLSYSGGPFSDASLRITLLGRNYNNRTLWMPGSSTEGNLFGTFHTLDTLDGEQDMNCSTHTDWAPYREDEHCVMGLVSQSGWASVDDSRTPVLDPKEAWVRPQTAGECGVNTVPCIGYGWDAVSRAACESSGCCWTERLVLNLWYSSQRHDHFSNTACIGCGNAYSFVRSQGYVLTENTTETVPLYVYWNNDVQDNVLASQEPTLPGYTLVSLVGYAFAREPNETALPLKLWYSPTLRHHFTTATAADETEARAGNYTFVQLMGFIPPPPSQNKPAETPPVACSQRSGNSDWYFLAHGADYRAALNEFTMVAGKIPIPRRHMLGLSWSRWGNIDQSATIQQVHNLAAANIPLDTYVFDMNWHLKPQWTGYTWDTNLYPDHVSLLGWLHERGLQLAANLHDAQGVMPFEKLYPQMAEANGIDPASNATVQFHISDRTFADSLHQVVLKPLAEEGLDFWWTDWQQGMIGVLDVAGLNPTIMLNHYRFMNYSGSSRRGLILSRFGGWGNHRYPVGFGGDVQQSWESIKFMVYMTATATNALFCWWGQEMMEVQGSVDYELFTRTMQFGAWSPVYTNYGNDGSDDNLWRMPQPFIGATQKHLALRAQTLPYRYTLAREAFDTGLGPLRPMYYEYPLAADAYNARQQFSLGTAFIVSPIFTPLNKATNTSTAKVWLPPGNRWVQFEAPYTVYEGNQWVSVQAPIDVVPVFAREGAVVPMLPYDSAIVHGSAARPYDTIELVAYLAPTTTTSGAGWLYEDDGMSEAYKHNVYSNTSIQYDFPAASKLSMSIVSTPAPAGCAAVRTYRVSLIGKPQPSQVVLQGVQLPQVDDVPPPAGTWSFATGVTHICIPPVPITMKQQVDVTW